MADSEVVDGCDAGVRRARTACHASPAVGRRGAAKRVPRRFAPLLPLVLLLMPPLVPAPLATVFEPMSIPLILARECRLGACQDELDMYRGWSGGAEQEQRGSRDVL